MTGHRVRRQQEGSGELLVIWALSPSCPSPGRSRFRTWIPKEQKGPGSAADLHRPLCVLLPHREQGAAEEPHGPSLHSPSTHCPSTLTTARGHIPLPAQCPSMEVTTVSPSAASPTEGDDLCETDVTTVATHSVTLLICLCGLAGNRAVVSLLSLKGDNFFIRGMAVTDFPFLLLTVPSALILLVEDVSCSLILPVLYLHFLFQLSLFSCYWAPLWLMTFSLAMYIKKLLKCCCRRDIPDHLLWVVMIVQFWAFSALFTEIPTLTSQCQSNDLEHCQAALITMWVIILLLLVTPITVLVISSTIKSIKAKWGSQQQQPEGLDIVIISIGLFTLLSILWNFLQQLGYIVVPSHFFSCSPASTAASTPSSTSWQGCAGGSVLWSPSGSPSRGSLSRKKKTLPIEMILPWTKGSESSDSSYCTA